MSTQALSHRPVVLSIVSGSSDQRQGSLKDCGSNDFLDESEKFDFDDFDSVQSVPTASFDDGQSQHTTELYELSLATTQSITSLLKLSIVIRNPAPKDRYAKLSVAAPMDSMYDIGHVWQKYPQTRNSLRG